MDGEWLYARNGKRHGPFPAERLKKLVSDGWLMADDLVWTKGMPTWVRAGDQEWLFGHKAARQLHEAFTALTVGRTPRPAVKTKQTATTKTTSPAAPLIDWDHIAPRHLVAALGAFMTLLGLAFTVIAHTPLSLALTIGGMVVVIGGLSVEIGRLFREAIGNSRSALDGRRRNLPERFEGPQTAAVLPEAEPLPAVKPAAAEPSSTSSPIAVPSGGSVTVINQMPVKRWSPGVAAVLTFFIPGLGQIYKGQVINGVVWFFLVTMGYAALILPGLILHFFCIIGALSGNPWTESKTTIVRQ
jgi:hypothetical protein